jgi:hypothetical protein
MAGVRVSRAFPLALALMACVSAVPTSGVQAAQTAKLRVSFDPYVTGERTTIKLSLRLSGSGGAPPAPLASLALRLPANMGIATTTLGQANCAPLQLIQGGLEGCSANARIGGGSASAVVPVGGAVVREKASLAALMGPAVENRLEVLFYVEALSPVFAQLVLPSVVEEDTAPYGEQLDTQVPLVQTWPDGPDLALETFTSTIGPLHLTYHRRVGDRTLAYHPKGVRLPERCPKGGFPFGALLSFQDATRTTIAYRVPCPSS